MEITCADSNLTSIAAGASKKSRAKGVHSEAFAVLESVPIQTRERFQHARRTRDVQLAPPEIRVSMLTLKTCEEECSAKDQPRLPRSEPLLH